RQRDGLGELGEGLGGAACADAEPGDHDGNAQPVGLGARFAGPCIGVGRPRAVAGDLRKRTVPARFHAARVDRDVAGGGRLRAGAGCGVVAGGWPGACWPGPITTSWRFPLMPSMMVMVLGAAPGVPGVLADGWPVSMVISRPGGAAGSRTCWLFLLAS